MFDSGNALAVNISMRFSVSDRGFCRKLKEGLEFMINREPPYLIHCEAGIDRTGFLSVILESFMGASFNDITKDYMLSFVDSSEYSPNDQRAGSVFIRNLFGTIKGGPVDDNEDLQSLSAKFISDYNYIGLGSGELKKLENKLLTKIF
jgi:hypothetical protein